MVIRLGRRNTCSSQFAGLWLSIVYLDFVECIEDYPDAHEMKSGGDTLGGGDSFVAKMIGIAGK